MDLVTLGTGNPLPSPDRAGPATLVRAAGHNLLFDAGRGLLMRLSAVGLGLPGFLHQTFLTHLHSDHTTDVTDLITTHWVTSTVASALGLTGPVGTRTYVDRVLASLADDVGYRIAHHDDLNEPPSVDVHEVSDGVAYSADGVVVRCAPVHHLPVEPAIGYRIEAEGKVVVIAGDTRPCDNLDRLCAGADVYVQTVVRPDLVKAMAAPRLHDILDYHSSCEEAGATAARNGVSTLVLTHFVPWLVAGTEDEWRALAATTFDGEIVVADDLTSVTA